MNLAFSETINGKESFFVQRIWIGIFYNFPLLIDTKWNFEKLFYDKFGFHLIKYYLPLPPKIHTIRHDPKTRWKVGMKIHPIINSRTKKPFSICTSFGSKGGAEN